MMGSWQARKHELVGNVLVGTNIGTTNVLLRRRSTEKYGSDAMGRDPIFRMFSSAYETLLTCYISLFLLSFHTTTTYGPQMLFAFMG